LSSLKWCVVAACCLVAGVCAGWFWPDPTRLVFLNVGQGDCAMIHAGGATILIDSGPRDAHSDAGERIVVPKLRAMGITGVDLILLSHPDMDHIGGTGAIVHAFPDAKIAVSTYFRHNHQLLEQLAKWGRRADGVMWLGDQLEGSIGEFRLRIDCPAIVEDEETNDGSMFVRIESGKASAVFSGDAPVKAEDAMESVTDWHSEIMKAGHHGSRSATSEGWIEAVRPDYAILSCGRNNRYGHPNKEVVDRLTADGVHILRTDRDGDIAFVVQDGKFVRE